MKDHSISVDRARYSTFIVAKYLDTATVKAIKRFYKPTLPSHMIFIKVDASTSYEQVEKLTRKFNIHYRACIGSLVYLLSTRVDLSFSVHKLEKFSENTVKVHFEVLVDLLRCIRYNNNLGLNYYYYINDAPVSDLLIQASIKTENQLMDFSDSSLQDFPYTVIITGAFIKFYQGGPSYHGTHIPGPVSQ